MKKYQVIIFDLDGTLSNSKEGITKSVQYALSKLGINEPDLKQLEHFIGPPLKDEFIKAYSFSEEDAIKGVEYYRERYVPIGIYETEIYPGIEGLLQNLREKGKRIAMATSKPQPMAEEVLKFLKIDQYFDIVMGAQLHGPRQSKQAVLEALFEVLDQKNKEEFLMVGDTCFDIEGANAVGIDSIGVDYGFGNKEEMLQKGAIIVADDAKQIETFIG